VTYLIDCMQIALHQLQMQLLPCRRYDSVASFDGETGNDGGGGVNGLPLEHTVFTLDDTVPWGIDRHHDNHQQGSELTPQRQQRGQPSGETSASEGASPGPVGKLPLAASFLRLAACLQTSLAASDHLHPSQGVTSVSKRMASKHGSNLLRCVPQTSCWGSWAPTQSCTRDFNASGR
jgi:hypothetical protein